MTTRGRGGRGGAAGAAELLREGARCVLVDTRERSGMLSKRQRKQLRRSGAAPFEVVREEGARWPDSRERSRDSQQTRDSARPQPCDLLRLLTTCAACVCSSQWVVRNRRSSMG